MANKKENHSSKGKKGKITLLYQVGSKEGTDIESYLTKKNVKFRAVYATNVDKPTLIIEGRAFVLKGKRMIKQEFK